MKKLRLIGSVILAVMLCFAITYLGIKSGAVEALLPKLIRNPAAPAIFSHSAGLLAMSVILITLLIRAFLRMELFKKQQEDMNRLFGSLFSGLRAGLVVFDETGIVRYINPAAVKLLQAKTVSLTPLIPYTEFIEPVLVPIAEKIASSVRTGEEFSREYRVFLPSGVCCVQSDFFPVTGPGKRIAYVLCLEDKTVEDDVKLRLSQQLEETHRYAVSKDNFFANMSHEIRTPINAILGMTYFLKKGNLEPKEREYVAKIDRASDLLLGVVNDILDFSKMQEHKFSLNPENFNLSDLKKILLDVFALKAEQKGLDLHVEFDCPDVYFVNGDQFRLTQIFMNLVSNAVKFTDKGFVSVAVNTEAIGNEIILRSTVRDTGCGIAEDDLEKLFTDFEQFGNVLHKNHEGTGLGLAISKRLVELMHGVIWVDSAPKKGSSFHFVVVLRRPEPDEPDEKETALPRIERKSGRALIVEDNEINREIALSLLAESGFTAESAEDGLAAIELCQTRAKDYYDLILMDIHMPRMNGYDAARVLKNELSLECPILAVTATSETADNPDTHRDVIAGYIIKPYDPAAFKTLFRSPSR